MKVKLVTALCIVWVAFAAFADDVAVRWKVENIRLEPRTEVVDGIPFNISDLTLNAIDMQHRTAFTLSAKVVLSEVRDTVLYGNKVALIGIAGNTEAVVIFDLARRKEIDWFYCGGAKQVMPGKIVLAMWVPNHPISMNDVVLMLYDLAKSPSANRLTIAPNAQFPLPVEAQGKSVINVGIPIYPQDNADEGSYSPASRESEEAIIGADLNTIMSVSSEKLVFVAEKGFGDTWLEILDLPHGTAKAKSRRIEIPRGQLQPDPGWLKNHPYSNPRRVEISKIEVISPTQVRLHIPAEEYGVDHLDIQIADRQ
jgi:hypothetical protein